MDRRAERVWTAARRLHRELAPLSFGEPVTHVYDPLEYAAAGHRAYVHAFAAGQKRVLFLGMNPGPFGMAQTGVPFGEVSRVRDWLGIEARIGRPKIEHPKRPILGFACTRSEVSGTRVWDAIADHWGTPERFFADHYIANYCPLLFMEETGRNRTPDKLVPAEREPLFAACDRHLKQVVRILEPEWVVGIGGFACKRAQLVLGDEGPKIGTILHPSPANPRANRGWVKEVDAQMRALGLCDGAKHRQ
ncbi:MAG: single-stranded DNA-binding protein [Candidatus Binatia bacterium]|nr:single-stranded DNA-binding protein [Candidatus Binatia bacterium]